MLENAQDAENHEKEQKIAENTIKKRLIRFPDKN